MEIALIEPEIPGNTGNIGRLCVGTSTTLHLVGRLGFDLSVSAVRRAGLDYWQHVDLRVWPDIEAWLSAMAGRRLHFFSAHAGQRYDRVRYEPSDVLVFGSESGGFPDWLRKQIDGRLVRVPIGPAIRSMNLANTASVALFEALRQRDFIDIGDRHAPWDVAENRDTQK